MLVVTVELRPGGGTEGARPIAMAIIANDGTGTAMEGRYDVTLAHAGKYWGKKGAWRAGKVASFARNLSPYHLVLKALRACLETDQRARDAWFEAYEERAAILEYDGGFARDEAERQALVLVGPPVRAKGAVCDV